MTQSAKTVGIIMDGNRRWAKAQGLDTLKGHEAGFRKVRDVVTWAIETNVTNLIFYAFSTENWNRSSLEVAALMKLMETVAIDRITDIEDLGVRIRVSGERERFSKKLQDIFQDVEERSKDKTTLTATFCLSYGGQRDIVQAVHGLVTSGTTSVTEELVRAHLWCADIPDPDIIVRTGGEKRLSNFLMWQSAYSELFFLDTLWPDFSKEEFGAVLADYQARKRNFGT